MTQRTLIVGAGMSGRIAKLIRPDAVLIERQKRGDHASSGFAGPVVVHEHVRELAPMTPIDRYVGWCPSWNNDPRSLSWSLQPLTEEVFEQYKMKKLGRKTSDKLVTASDSAATGKRFEFMSSNWCAAEPQVEVKWGVSLTEIALPLKRAHLGSEGWYDYDTLVWTGPLPVLMQMLPGEYAFSVCSKPFWFRRTKLSMSHRCPSRPQMFVEHVPHLDNPVYRRTLYVYADGSQEVGEESSEKLEGFSQFWPGSIEAHPEVPTLLEKLRTKGIVCAGRFARWDPDEHLHTTAEFLRKALR